MPVALTIAGSDSGGGAGIQADLRTFSSLGVWGVSAITALTAQNTMGVQKVLGVSAEFINDQLRSVLEDIPVDAVKTGMLWSRESIEIITDNLTGRNFPLVIDPVLFAKRGEQLLLSEARSYLIEHLFPLATIVTPNIPEAQMLTDLNDITTFEKMLEAAQRLIDCGVKCVLLKGGHFKGAEGHSSSCIIDLYYDGKEFIPFEKKRIQTNHLHGDGCTFASAIAAFLAKGYELKVSVQFAQEFISKAIEGSFALGNGIGPVYP